MSDVTPGSEPSDDPLGIDKDHLSSLSMHSETRVSYSMANFSNQKAVNRSTFPANDE
jgi:hypothetical protein